MKDNILGQISHNSRQHEINAFLLMENKSLLVKEVKRENTWSWAGIHELLHKPEPYHHLPILLNRRYEPPGTLAQVRVTQPLKECLRAPSNCHLLRFSTSHTSQGCKRSCHILMSSRPQTELINQGEIKLIRSVFFPRIFGLGPERMEGLFLCVGRAGLSDVYFRSSQQPC